MSLWNAKSVDPDTVGPADIAEIAAEFNIDLGADVPAGFFQPGETYRRYGDTFRCAVVGMRNDGAAAIGYLPINLAGEVTWEFAVFNERTAAYDGWTKVDN